MFKIARVYGFIALEAESLKGARMCPSFCFCLSVAVTQNSDKGHLKEQRFILAHGARVCSILTRKQKEGGMKHLLSRTLRSQAQGMVPSIEGNLPTAVNLK